MLGLPWIGVQLFALSIYPLGRQSAFSIVNLVGSCTCVMEIAEDENTTQQVVRGNSATRVAWLILNIWPSHFGLPLLIATIFIAKTIRRHATFINLCMTWIIVGISSSLLLYAGFQTGPEPPRLLCLIQASLLYGQPGLTSLSAFSLVFQVFHVMRAAFRERDPERHETLRKWLLVITPYIAFVSFATWTAFVGSNDPGLVNRKRRFFYCSVKDSSLTNTITAFSLGVLLITVCLEFWILYIVLSHWRVFRANGLGASIGMDVSLICRTAAFALWIFLGMSLSALSIKAPRSSIPDMALATMGSAVVLVFGTQRDIIQAWMFWKRNKRKVRRTSTSSTDRAVYPLSDHSMKGEQSSPLSDRSDSLPQDEREHKLRPKPKGPVSGRDISQPALRDDLTFTVFGIAI